jgi:hypothetical protein
VVAHEYDFTIRPAPVKHFCRHYRLVTAAVHRKHRLRFQALSERLAYRKYNVYNDLRQDTLPQIIFQQSLQQIGNAGAISAAS